MVRLLLVLLRWLGMDVRVLPPEVLEVVSTLVPLVRKFEDVPQSSDWKRKEVYALGMKAFPEKPKHIIAYALEHAVWLSK